MRHIKQILKDIILNVVINSYTMPSVIRKKMYKLMGYNIQGTICPDCFCGFGPGKLHIGKGSSVNYMCFFDLGEDILIGDNCNISYQVTFINSSHNVGLLDRRAGEGWAKPIQIGNGCWIGARTTIMPGVIIGEGCIIGADSLVTTSCKPNGCYVGRPAKRIKELK